MLCVSPQRSARAASEESDAIFTELIRSMELKRFEVRELIKAQEKVAITEAEQLLEKIQKEIVELKKSEAELDQLSRTEDPVHFLQVIPFRCSCGFSISRDVDSAAQCVLCLSVVSVVSLFMLHLHCQLHLHSALTQAFPLVWWWQLCLTLRDSYRRCVREDLSASMREVCTLCFDVVRKLPLTF